MGGGECLGVPGNLRSHMGMKTVDSALDDLGKVLSNQDFDSLSCRLPWWLSGKESACNAGVTVRSPGLEDALEEVMATVVMATHCRILAWRITWTEEHMGYSPWGGKESDTTEGPLHTRVLCCFCE